MLGVRLEINVLGPLDVRLGGRPVVIEGAKPRAVLTALGLNQGRLVAASTLNSLLWGDDPPRTARKALQTHISTLRRALGDGVVVTAGSGWMLRAKPTDATRFVVAVERGRQRLRAADPAGAVPWFDKALALWRGTPQLCPMPRSGAEVTRWVEEQLALVEDRFEALLRCGRATAIVGELEAAVGAEPLRERRWTLLCHALYLASRQADALAAYHRARHTLARELGVEPGPLLRRMQAAILAHDPALNPLARQRPEVPLGQPRVEVFDGALELSDALATRYREGSLVALVMDDVPAAEEATRALIAYLRQNLHGGQVALLLA